MNYSYFEGKKVDPTEIIELAKTVPFLMIIDLSFLTEQDLVKKVMIYS